MRHQEVFTGNIGQVRDLKTFGDGGFVLNFSIAENVRVKKDNEWTDGTPIWTNVTLFGVEAQNLAKIAKPGLVVTVIGERRAEEYTPEGGEKRVTQKVIASQVSVAVTRFQAVTEVAKVGGASSGGSGSGGSKGADFSGDGDDPFGLD